MSAIKTVGGVPYTAELEESLEGSDEWVLEDSPPISDGSPIQEPALDDVTPQILSSEVHVAQSIVAMDAVELEVVLSIIAPLGESAARPPLHLVAVLDKSGSMHGEKLRLVVETMCFMLQHLTERDTVGFVEYGSEVTVLAAPTRCDAAGKARLEKCLRSMKPGGQTNLSGGLLRGVELHGQDASHFAPPARICGPSGSSESAAPAVVSDHDGREACSDGSVRSCFLFTDGLANVGISKPEAICQAAISALDELGGRRCTLSTFGFGADHSADLLRALAKAGGGEYSFIEGEESIGEAFGTVLGGLLSTTHQNVRLSLELAPGVALSRAKTTRTVESLHGPEGAIVLSIDLGDLFAEERRDILLALSLPDAPEGEQVLGTLRARGFSVLTNRSEDCRPIEMTIQRAAGAGEASVANPQVASHQNRYLATTALETARAAGGRGELGAAKRCLEAASERIAASDLAVQGDLMTVNLLTDIRECLTDFQHQQSQRSQAAVCNKMASMSYGHERQRACGTASSFQYSNPTSRHMGQTCHEYTSKRG